MPTSHVLIIQTDVLLRRRIPAKFFEYDYVGAPWPLIPKADVLSGDDDILQGQPRGMHSGLKAVGNGGFSLRRVEAMSALCVKYDWKEEAKRCLEMATWRKPCWLGVQEEVSRDNPATYFTDEDVFLSARLPPDVLPYNHIGMF